MGVRNYQSYKLTEHARDRIYSRFNITKNEIDVWLSRLLSQCAFVEDQDNGRKKYRFNDIVVVVDPKQLHIVTVYSENAHDDMAIGTFTNPEIKSTINQALTSMIKKRKITAARKMQDLLKSAVSECDRMVKPGTNYRYSDAAWDELISNLEKVEHIRQNTSLIIEEAEEKIKEK